MIQIREAQLKDIQQLLKLEKSLFSKWDKLDPINKIDLGGLVIKLIKKECCFSCNTAQGTK